tara:strand:+ start:128 stop:259 length:132 start_codon:yes stop_codon:yes gene_type:complete
MVTDRNNIGIMENAKGGKTIIISAILYIDNSASKLPEKPESYL